MTGFQDRASLCCPRSSEGQCGLRVVLRIGWGGKGFIEPRHQIAMGEQIHAQQRNQIGQAPAKTGGQLQVTQQQHRDQCSPNLCLDRVSRRADEGLDLQVLLERLEEQFDLPAIFVDRGNGAGPQAVMIGEEDEDATRILAHSLDATQQMRALVLGTGAGQADGLILEDVPVLRRRMFFDHLKLGVVLHARDEVHAGIRPFGEQAIVVVAPVVHHDGARRKVHLPSSFDVVHLALSDETEARQVTVMVENKMQFDRALGAAELRPVVHGQAQVDHGRIKADQFVLEAELLLAHDLGGDDLEQAIEHLFEQFPRAMAIGIGQRRTGGGFYPQVCQFAFATLQPTFDLPQGMRPPQLAEQHGYELAPARQTLRAVFRSSVFDDALKVATRNELEYLTEHAA